MVTARLQARERVTVTIYTSSRVIGCAGKVNESLCCKRMEADVRWDMVRRYVPLQTVSCHVLIALRQHDTGAHLIFFS